MDMGTAANIAEIAGGIAILVSITYAGFQIRQSNRLARVESIRSTQSNSFLDEYDMAIIGKGLVSFDSLDYADKWEFHCYFLRFLSHYAMVIQTHELGMAEGQAFALKVHQKEAERVFKLNEVRKTRNKSSKTDAVNRASS